jgi:hypothetical protein
VHPVISLFGFFKMALEKQLIPLNIAVAANQKVDSNTLQPGTPSTVNNIRYRKANRIDKRTGYSTLTMTDIDSNSITGCEGIIGTDNNLLLYASDTVYSYVENADKWKSIGTYINCETSISSINEDSDPIFLNDSETLGGYTYYVYSIEKDTNGSATDIYLIVVDAETNQIYSGPTWVNDSAISSAAAPIANSDIKFLKFNGGLYLFYSEENSSIIYGRRVGPAYTNFLDTESDLINDYYVPTGYFINHFAVLNWSDTRIVIAYPEENDPSKETINIRYFDSTLTELTGSYALRQITSILCAQFVQLIESSSGDKFFVIGCDTVSSPGVHDEFEYAIIDEDGSLDTGVTAITMNTGSPFSTSNTCRFLMGTPETYNSKTGVRVHVVLNHNSINQFDQSTYQLHLANDGTLSDYYNGGSTANQDFMTLWDLNPITREITYNSRVYQVFQRCVNNDSCYYLITFINYRPYVVSQFLYGRVLDVDSFSPCRRADRNLYAVSSGVLEFSAISKDSATEVTGLIKVRFDMTKTDLFNGIPYGRSIIIAGTNLHTFDGHYIRELGFFHRPKAPTLAQGSYGAAAIADGTYSVLFVFEYSDRNGLLHRSSPSDAASITISSGSGQAKITCTISTYCITNLLTNSDITDGLVKIIPYRTSDGGSIYYREAYFDNYVASLQDPAAYTNDPFSHTITIDLYASDTVLEAQAVLYTDSGEIPPAPIPPVKYITTWNKRIICAGTSRDENVFYSKINQTNLIPEFTETLSIGIQELSGKTTGIIGFADKLILSKRGRFYYSYGEGPDNTGQGGDFALFEQILGVSGAVNGPSMAINKEGLYYKSDKGVFILSGGLSTEHIGALYEDIATEAVIKTVSPITSETIRILINSGIIEHDTFFGTWSLQTGLTPLDATIYDNTFYLLADDDVVYKEDKTVFKDGSASYAMLIETGWISLASILGYQRLYKIIFKATYKSIHTLRVSIAYDYNETYIDSVDLDPADAIDNDTYRFIIYVRQQKCQSFRLKFQEIITDGTAGTHESLEFNFVGVQVGIKRGLPKLKDAQKVSFAEI